MAYVEYGVHDTQEPSPEDLGRANRFSMHDLAENRQGKISSSQLILLFGRALEPIRYTAPVAGGWLLVWYLINYVPGLRLMATLMWLFGSSAVSPAVFFAITALCCGMLLVSILKSARSIGLLLVDLSYGNAARIE